MPRNEFSCDCDVVHADTVNFVRGQMACDELLASTARFFKVLGDMTRVRIIFALDTREMCVCDLANLLGMTKSAISHQLATLREAGFVKCRRDGKTVFYSLADAHVSQILRLGMEHVQE